VEPAVALVRAYLQINGYFTVTDYPVVEAVRAGEHRATTDLDILAVRFPGVSRLIARRGKGVHADEEIVATDPALACPAKRIDLLIGEVKEGRAAVNPGARSPEVMRAALMRFGCCGSDDVALAVTQLLRHGLAVLPAGHQVRLVAFGSSGEESNPNYHTVFLRQVVGFLREYLREHWSIMRHANTKDSALGLLMTLEKAGTL